MPHKKAKSKNSKNENNGISVEGSRELEPQVVPTETAAVLPRSRLSRRTVTIASVIIIVVLLIASLPAYYVYNQYQTEQRLKNPTAAAEEQLKEITADVGKLIVLPKDEKPTLATVSDKTKLVGQQFFANSQNGDKVLIYTNAKKAFLYRPSIKKIIEVGPINITGSTGTPNGEVAGASSAASLTPAPVRVGLLNGTTVVGLTKKIESVLVSKVPGVEVVLKDNAAKNDYPQTLVIAVSSSQTAVAEQIAKTLGGKVTTLPSGEVTPADAEITVILGQNSTQ